MTLFDLEVTGDQSMSRPYVSFQIDQLEAEFERAREIGDAGALGNLRAELTQFGRRQTPRVTRLTTLVEEGLNGVSVDGRGSASSNHHAQPVGEEPKRA